MNEKLYEAFLQAIEISNQRGHASSLARSNATKAQLELVWARQWATSMDQEFGRNVQNVQLNPSDPPDCIALENEAPIAIEITELVKGELLAKLDPKKHEGRAPNTLDPIRLFDGSEKTKQQLALFQEALWSEEEFHRRLSELVIKKCTKQGYLDKEPFDVLLVLCCEPFLDASKLRGWISTLPKLKCCAFKEIFLLLDYEPAFPKGKYPLFKVL